jgi:hypothetical protein
MTYVVITPVGFAECYRIIVIAMSGHGHGCDGDHNRDETPEVGLQYSLYSKIDFGNLECLNEKSEGSGRDVFKAWEDRLDFEKVSFVYVIYEYFVVLIEFISYITRKYLNG